MWEILPAIVSLLGMFKGGSTPAQTSSATIDPDIQAMLASQRKRTTMQDPLFEAVTRMAMGLLPTQYRRDITGFGPSGLASGGPNGGPTGPGGTGGTYGSPPYVRPRNPYAPWSTPDELRNRQRNPPTV